jgi:ubiquinone/menaquinone biosynthesis C-methylase UbiE
MDTALEADDYDAMDHAAVNTTYVGDLLAVWQPRAEVATRVLDVGTGTALIPLEIAKNLQHAHILGIDLASHMLAVAQRNVELANLNGRVSLANMDAKALPLSEHFDAVVSNSVVHHIPEPVTVLRVMRARTKPDGVLFVRDLVRPNSVAEIERLVTMYSGLRPSEIVAAARWDRQRELFAASLHAALSLEEIRAVAEAIDIPSTCVQLTSDRHWTLAWLPAGNSHA